MKKIAELTTPIEEMKESETKSKKKHFKKGLRLLEDSLLF